MGNIRIIHAVKQGLGEVDRVQVVPLGLIARSPRRVFVKRLGYDRKIRACLCFIEPDHLIAGLDAIAVAYPHLADDAAGGVLNFLDIGIYDQKSPRDDRT
jgi:hypothetical protein